MTNEAISAILDYLHDEAQNSAQASFAIRDLLRDLSDDSEKKDLAAAGTASADRLQRSIGDVRELLAPSPAAPCSLEEFDFAVSVREVVDVLNMASGKRVREMMLDGSHHSLPVTQDRRALEQILTRILDTALKLAGDEEVPLRLRLDFGDHRVQFAILLREAALALRLVTWLKADPNGVTLGEEGDVPFGVALMAAGKRLRALGGAVELGGDADGRSMVALGFPSEAPAFGKAPNVQPGTLKILVAEDNDESFALTELVLQDEQVFRAHDGQEALRMIQKQRFDVVFMDIHMPGMDGYEVIRSMRDWETQTGCARTPMVVLSSDDLETQHRSAAEFGCSGFLRKPLQRWDLMPLLDRLR